MEGYSVLIVDDEPHAINGIVASVDWIRLGISSVYTANSFEQAQRIFNENSINLLLTDIDMPKGTGIDLLHWVREKGFDTEAVFLTCHSDFTYAQEAIRLKSISYLLKPIDHEELEKVIQGAIAKIKSDRQVMELETTFIHIKEMNENLTKEGFWAELVNQTIPFTPVRIKKNLEHFQLNYREEERFLPIIIHVYSDEGLPGEKQKKIEEAVHSLKSAVVETIAEYDKEIVVIHHSPSYLLVIVPEKSAFTVTEITEHTNRFIRTGNDRFGYNICCYVGEYVPIIGVDSMVQQLYEIDHNNVSYSNQTFAWKEPKKEQYFTSSIPQEKWINLLKSGEKEELLLEVEAFILSWKETELPLTWNSLYDFYQDFLQIIFYILQQKELEASYIFSKDLFEKPETVLKTVESLKEWVFLVIHVVMEQIHGVDVNNTIVDRVKAYVNENIHLHRLTREDIANYVYFNPDYLARVFKKETGSTISEYIMLQKMEHAKRLLAETNMPISQVALESGYSNFSYFSTLFKKMYHNSPNEFRKQK